MKKSTYIIFTVFLLAASTFAGAQTQVVDAGVYENISETFTLHEDGSQEYRYYKKLRFNTYDAFNRFYGETFIVYNSEYQTLKINKSFTTMADGKVVETPPNAFNEVLPSFAAKAPAYNHLKEMVVTHTGLELGAVVELDYTIITKPGFYSSFGNKVAFMEEIPVKDYTVTVKVPSGTKMGHGLTIGIIPEPKPEQQEGMEVYTWNIKNIPPAYKERQMPFEEKTNPVLLFSTTRDFQSLYKELVEQPAFQHGNLPPSAEKFVDGIVKDNRLEIMQVLKIQEYIVDNINTINIPDAFLGYRYATPQDVWNRNYGTVAEKAILMAALLGRAGITAYPAMVAPGEFYKMAVASPLIFDDWVVKIVLSDDTPVYLSPVKFTEVNMKYKYLEDCVARPLASNISHLQPDIFSAVSPDNRLSGFMTLDKDNNLMGHLTIRVEAGMNPYIDIEKDINHVKKLLTAIPEKSITGIGSKKPNVSEAKTEVTLDFTLPDAWKERGGYYFMEIPDLKASVAATDFGPLPAKRDAPFVIPKFKTTTNIQVVIPDDYVLVTSVEKTSRKSFGHYRIEIKAEGNTIKITRQMELTELELQPMHYDVFRAFITEWNDTTYKQLIFKKK